jgi:hypothetical protein
MLLPVQRAPKSIINHHLVGGLGACRRYRLKYVKAGLHKTRHAKDNQSLGARLFGVIEIVGFDAEST